MNNASTGARTFVDEFYKWYTPIANKNSRVPPWYTVLDQRPVALSDTLLRALRRDREEQSKVTGEIVGLDFDPFLGGQDPVSTMSQAIHCKPAILIASAYLESAERSAMLRQMSLLKSRNARARGSSSTFTILGPTVEIFSGY